VVTHKATFYPSAIRTCMPGAKHPATGFYSRVIRPTAAGGRAHGYVKAHIRPMRGLKSFASATRLCPALHPLQFVERDFVHSRRWKRQLLADAAMLMLATWPASSPGWARPCSR
jgi:hypothetical protein